MEMAEVDVALTVGQSLGPFTLGQTLFSIVQALQSQQPNLKVHVFNNANPHCATTVVAIPQNFSEGIYVLVFDSALQMLISISYDFSKVIGVSQKFTVYGNNINATLTADASLEEVKDVLGKPNFIKENVMTLKKHKTVITYDGLSFLFAASDSFSKPKLTEIRVASCMGLVLSKLWYSTFIAKTTPQNFNAYQIQLVVDSTSRMIVGVQFTQSSADDHTQEVIWFGDHFQDVVSKLGCSSRIYYKDNNHFNHIGPLAKLQQKISAGICADVVLNYHHLGIDILLDSTKNTVAKIVMHTNVPDHIDYCCYSRCFFIFSVTKSEIAIDCSSKDTLLVCPDTNWGVIQSFVEPEYCRKLKRCHFSPSTNSHYFFSDTSLHILCNQIIAETTRSNFIASLTLLAPPSSLLIASKGQHQSTQPQTLHPTQEVEIEVPISIPILKHRSLNFDLTSINSDGDDEFHSAESSLSGITENVQLSQAEKINVHHPRIISSVSEKMFLGPNVNVIVHPNNFATESLPVSTTRTLVYDFHDDHPEASSIANSKSDTDNVKVQYTSSDMTVSVLMHESASEGSSDGDSTPELDSFDFISHSEMLESQVATIDLTTTETSQDSSKTTSGDDNLTPQSESCPSPEPEFRYMPQVLGTDLHLSRTAVLDEDTGLLSKSRTEMIDSSFFKENKGSSSPIIIQKRSSSSSSAKLETKKRLFSHTKSSQQRVKQKYIPPVPLPKIYDGEQTVDSEYDTKLEEDKESEVCKGVINKETIPPVTETVGISPCLPLPDSAPRTGVNCNKDESTLYQLQTPSIDDAPEYPSLRSSSISQELSNNTNILPSLPIDNMPLSVSNPNSPSDDHFSTDLQSSIEATLHHDEHDLSSSPISTETPNKAKKLDAGLLINYNSSSDIEVRMDTDHKIDKQDISSQAPTDSSVSACEEDLVSPTSCRKLWEDNGGAVCPEYGPPSMTQDRVFLELVACEHEEVCKKLKERNEGLFQVQQMLANPERTVNLSEVRDELLDNEVFLCDLLSGLNSREMWTLKLSSQMLKYLKSSFQPGDSRRLILASQAVQQICNTHFSLLTSYMAGKVTLFTPNDLSLCRSCCSALSELSVSVAQCLASLQKQSDVDTGTIQKLTEVKTVLANVIT